MGEWIHWGDEDPKAVGWYPVMLCWDSQEGSFMDTAYWNGSAWEGSSGLCTYYTQSFGAEEEAQKYADDHDVSF